MAGDWIKMRTALWDHPKVVRIVSAICPQSVRDLSARCRVIGALYRTWSLADAHTEDGILDGYDAEALDAAVGIDGWSANLQHVGWLIIEPQRLIVTRFMEHGGQTAKRRSEDAARKGRVRKTSAKCPQNVRSDADKMRNREEKRREDINPPLSPLGEGERERLVGLAAERNVHQAESAVDDALARGCQPRQIERACQSATGKALLALIGSLRPPSDRAKSKRAEQSREERRLRIIRENDAAGVPREQTNEQLLAAGLEGIVVSSNGAHP